MLYYAGAVGYYVGVVIWIASYVYIEIFGYFEHVLFWMPLLNQFLQVVLLPMAAVFYIYPDTVWTKPELFPTTYPESLYTWAVGKILFFGSLITIPMTFLGHPFNLTIVREFDKFASDKFTAISSQKAALIFIVFWMSLPYLVPFAWANDFYLWYLQIPLEVVLWIQYNFHLTIHYDYNCNLDYQ